MISRCILGHCSDVHGEHQLRRTIHAVDSCLTRGVCFLILGFPFLHIFYTQKLLQKFTAPKATQNTPSRHCHAQQFDCSADSMPALCAPAFYLLLVTSLHLHIFGVALMGMSGLPVSQMRSLIRRSVRLNERVGVGIRHPGILRSERGSVLPAIPSVRPDGLAECLCGSGWHERPDWIVVMTER